MWLLVLYLLFFSQASFFLLFTSLILLPIPVSFSASPTRPSSSCVRRLVWAAPYSYVHRLFFFSELLTLWPVLPFSFPWTPLLFSSTFLSIFLSSCALPQPELLRLFSALTFRVQVLLVFIGVFLASSSAPYLSVLFVSLLLITWVSFLPLSASSPSKTCV